MGRQATTRKGDEEAEKDGKLHGLQAKISKLTADLSEEREKARRFEEVGESWSCSTSHFLTEHDEVGGESRGGAGDLPGAAAEESSEHSCLAEAIG